MVHAVNCTQDLVSPARDAQAGSGPETQDTASSPTGYSPPEPPPGQHGILGSKFMGFSKLRTLVNGFSPQLRGGRKEERQGEVLDLIGPG